MGGSDSTKRRPSRGQLQHDIIAARLAQLVADIDRASRAVVEGEREGIHDLRVAIRRSRSCLRTFRALFERDRAEHLRAELRGLATLVGAARDPEMLARRFEARLATVDVEERLGPVRRELVGGMRAAAERGRAAVIEALTGEQFRPVLASLEAFAQDPPYRGDRPTGDAGALLHCLRKERRRVSRRADRAERLPAGAARDAAFHEVRKRAKRVRYAAETLVPLAPKAARRMAGDYAAVQDLLGERQDAAVSRRLLVREGARIGVQPGHNGFTYGLLAAQELHAIGGAEREWPAVRKRTARTKSSRLARG